MKKVLFILIITCLVTNIAYADTLSKIENTDKARNLAIFPGFFIHGLGSYYLDDDEQATVPDDVAHIQELMRKREQERSEGIR